MEEAIEERICLLDETNMMYSRIAPIAVCRVLAASDRNTMMRYESHNDAIETNPSIGKC